MSKFFAIMVADVRSCPRGRKQSFFIDFAQEHVTDQIDDHAKDDVPGAV